MRKKAELFLSYTALVLALFLPPAGLILGIIAYKFRIDKEHKITIAAIVIGAIMSLAILLTIIIAFTEYNSLERGVCVVAEGFECQDLLPFANAVQLELKYLALLEIEIKDVFLTDINQNKISECFVSTQSLRQNQEIQITCETPRSNSYFFEIQYFLDPNKIQTTRAYYIQ
ncbi:MAG: hypothetical protein ACMXX6_00675 [Candidatus Woesearchaeota archaeon]